MSRYRVRPDTCEGCGVHITQPRRGMRLYCTPACKSRAWYAEHGGWQYYAGPPAPREPMPMPYVGHPIFEQACKAAKLDLTTSYSVDWGQNDILGEAVLAIVEGRDPLTAVKQWRSHEYNIHRAERWVTDEEWEHIA